MSRKAAILGLGARGCAWAEMFREAGWRVSGFDPDPAVQGLPAGSRGWRREDAISTAVGYADWVVVSLPDRLELMQMVMQRAQAAAPEGAVFAVHSANYDADAVQGCAIRPAQVVLVTGSAEDGFDLNVTSRNSADLTVAALAVLSEVSPKAVPLGDALPGVDQLAGSKSA